MIFATGTIPIDADQTIYFLVASPRRSDWVLVYDSYVLPLSKQDDIDHARFLISLGPLVFTGPHAQIAVAKVGPGRDGINRNYVDPRFPEWSWHIVEPLGFGDITAEELDGTPTQVENQPSWYLQTDVRQGLIGFWAYTVVKELGPMPLYLSIIPNGQNLEFYWSGVGTNYLYTLEAKDSLVSSNWLPLPGASWPLKTNKWILAQANAPVRFYRVRAEQAQ